MDNTEETYVGTVKHCGATITSYRTVDGTPSVRIDRRQKDRQLRTSVDQRYIRTLADINKAHRVLYRRPA